MHVSDCALNEGGTCDCKGLELAVENGKDFIAAFVPVTGRFGFFFDYMGGQCFIDPESLPAHILTALAASADLPDAHDLIALLGTPDGMNFNDAREAVISKLKAKTSVEGVTSGLCVQLSLQAQL